MAIRASRLQPQGGKFQEGRFVLPIRKPFQGPQLLWKDDNSHIPAAAPQLVFQTLWTANNLTFGFRSERIAYAKGHFHGIMLGAEEAACSLGTPMPARGSGVDTVGLLGAQSFQSGASEKSLREMNPQLRLKIGRILQEKAGMGFPGLSKGAKERSNRSGQRSRKQLGEGGGLQ